MHHTQKSLKFKKVKLGRQGIHGLADQYPLLIEERIRGKKKLEIMVHEMLHYIYKSQPEENIEKAAILITNTLWNEGYREVDNSNDLPLQDGSL